MTVFTYYMLTQSAPGRGNGPTEPEAVQANVGNADTMRAYFEDLRLFFLRAAPFGRATDRRPRRAGPLGVPAPAREGRRRRAASRSSSARAGLPELADLPDDLSGFARAIMRLRDRDGAERPARLPRQQLGHAHRPLRRATPAMRRSTTSRGARPPSIVRSAPTSTWRSPSSATATPPSSSTSTETTGGPGGTPTTSPGTSASSSRFVDLTGKRIVLWQIPYGNTRMRAMNNTWNHYQDNRVEWLLDDPEPRASATSTSGPG